jgi:hypothetical protein
MMRTSRVTNSTVGRGKVDCACVCVCVFYGHRDVQLHVQACPVAPNRVQVVCVHVQSHVQPDSNWTYAAAETIHAHIRHATSMRCPK